MTDVTAQELANHFGVSRRTIHDWVGKNILPERGPDGWNLDECTAAALPHLEAKAQKTAITAEIEYQLARLNKERADSLAMQNEQRRAQFIPASDVPVMWAAIQKDCTDVMLGAIPRMVDAVLAAKGNPHVVQDGLRDVIYDCLTKLSEMKYEGEDEQE